MASGLQKLAGGASSQLSVDMSRNLEDCLRRPLDKDETTEQRLETISSLFQGLDLQNAQTRTNLSQLLHQLEGVNTELMEKTEGLMREVGCFNENMIGKKLSPSNVEVLSTIAIAYLPFVLSPFIGIENACILNLITTPIASYRALNLLLRDNQTDLDREISEYMEKHQVSREVAAIRIKVNGQIQKIISDFYHANVQTEAKFPWAVMVTVSSYAPASQCVDHLITKEELVSNQIAAFGTTEEEAKAYLSEKVSESYPKIHQKFTYGLIWSSSLFFN